MAEGEIAIVDRTRYALAANVRRIPRQAWAQLRQADAVLRAAEALLRRARAESDAMRASAAQEGRAAGRAAAAADAAELFVQAQDEARAFIAGGQARVAQLALAIVERVLPQLVDANLVAALVEDALRVAEAERWLRVRVHPNALERVRERLPRWRESYPQLAELQLIADAQLPEHGCIVESEAGVLKAGLQDRIGAVRSALQLAASGG